MLSVINSIYAQQEPMNTMFAYNKLPVNAAYTGGKDLISMRMVYRHQWTNLPGAPQTINFNIHSPLKKERIALGLSVLNDRLGSTKQTWIMPSFAYRIPFKNDTKLSFGISAGVLFYKTNLVTLEAVNVGDPLLENNLRGVSANAGVGMYYYGQKFYFGISMPNILPLNYIKNKDNNQLPDRFKMVPHLYIMGGYTFEIGKKKKFWIQPQLLMKYIASTKFKVPFEMDVNTTFTIYKIFNFGATYRTGLANKFDNRESVDVMGLFNIPKGFSIGYSYDITISRVKYYNNGTHEIMIGYDFDTQKKGVRTPRYF
jgi:type IX secretion system PorP/SprF family membrane protein